MKTRMVWHYTTGRKFISIVQDGCIRPTAVLIDKGERPAAWFSARQDWEPSATKGCIDKETGERRDCTFDEMYYGGGGLVRIGIAEDSPSLVSWSDFKKQSGISPETAAALEQFGSEKGVDPDDWYAVFGNVPRENWIAVHVYSDGQWVDVPLHNETEPPSDQCGPGSASTMI